MASEPLVYDTWTSKVSYRNSSLLNAHGVRLIWEHARIIRVNDFARLREREKRGPWKQ